MDTRLIFLDIDGTFIEPGRMEAPASAVEAVRAAQANGHRVFLCTGRNYRMTSPVLRYGFDGYVCSAGGYVVWRRAFADGMLIRPLEEYQGEPIYKICYIAPGQKALAPARAAYEDQFVFCEGGGPAEREGFVSGELINRKFNKGAAILRICAHLGLPASASVAFGDSANDLEMADVAGHGQRCAGPQGPLHPGLPRRQRRRHRHRIPGAGVDLNKKRYKKARPNVRPGFLSSSVFYLSRFHSTAPSAKKQAPMA